MYIVMLSSSIYRLTSCKLISRCRSMTGQSKELRSVVAVIAFKMLLDRGHHEQQFSSHEIGLTLGGLQSIDCKSCPEVLIVLDKIAKRMVLASSSSFSSRHAALALYGLKALTPSAGEHAEIRAILSVLAERSGCRHIQIDIHVYIHSY